MPERALTDLELYIYAPCYMEMNIVVPLLLYLCLVLCRPG